jgi:hypothetical protein
MVKNDPLLTTLDAARILTLSPDAVRQLARAGSLVADEETPSGQRLFRRSTVEKLASERKANPPKRGPKPKVAKEKPTNQ